MELPTFWVAVLGASVQFYDVNRIRARVIEAGSGPPVVMIHGLGGHAENFYAQRWDYVLTPERLKIIPAVTLPVWSRHNTPGVDAAQQMARLMPHATLQVLENSGHWPHVEEAEAYNRLLRALLAG